MAISKKTGYVDMQVRLPKALSARVEWFAKQCDLTPGQMISAIVVLDSFHKGWHSPATELAKEEDAK